MITISYPLLSIYFILYIFQYHISIIFNNKYKTGILYGQKAA